MDRTEIVNIIIEICKKIKPTTKNFDKEYLTEALTSTKIDFTDQDLVYLFLELTERFNVSFTKEDVSDYKFNYVEKIADIIHSKIG